MVEAMTISFFKVIYKIKKKNICDVKLDTININ